MNIKNYAICVEGTAPALVEMVSKACQDGWLPIGGVSLSREAASPGVKAKTIYAQAMVLPLRQQDIIGQVVASVNGHG